MKEDTGIKVIMGMVIAILFLISDKFPLLERVKFIISDNLLLFLGVIATIILLKTKK